MSESELGWEELYHIVGDVGDEEEEDDNDTPLFVTRLMLMLIIMISAGLGRVVSLVCC